MLRELHIRILALLGKIRPLRRWCETARPADPVISQVPSEAHTNAYAAGLAAGEERGRNAERERIRSILIHESAAGRPELARSLAFATDLDAESCSKALSVSPKPGRAGMLAWKPAGRSRTARWRSAS